MREQCRDGHERGTDTQVSETWLATRAEGRDQALERLTASASVPPRSASQPAVWERAVMQSTVLPRCLLRLHTAHLEFRLFLLVGFMAIGSRAPISLLENHRSFLSALTGLVHRCPAGPTGEASSRAKWCPNRGALDELEV